jgi:hypothetical protein
VRSLFLSRRNDVECADEEECWNEQRKKERAILSSHVINPSYSKVTPQLRGAPIFARLRYPPGLMRLHYSSSVNVCQPIRPIPTFVAAGISQFSCTRPGQYGLPVLGFAKPQFSTFVCEDLKSSDRFLLPDFVTPDSRITGESFPSARLFR